MDSSLGDEFALFADESLEWAELTLPTALEGWEYPAGMSADQPCTDCGGQAADTTTRAERALAIVGLFAGTVIAYMAVDIISGGRISEGLARLFGAGVGREAETYLKAAQHDRRG